MKLWKTFNVQKREDISYYNTSEGFETEGFAMHLDRLIREEMAAKGKDGIMFLCIGTDPYALPCNRESCGILPVRNNHLH